MQYKVPQDVQREDTIIGPLTLKQLGMLGIGGAITYAIYISLAKTYFLEVWLAPVVITGALTLAFTFLKIHSLPFHEFLMHFLEYHILPRNRFWIQGTGYPFISPFEDQNTKKAVVVTTTAAKPQKSLEELTKVLDTHGGADELSEDQKKEELNKIISQNYKN